MSNQEQLELLRTKFGRQHVDHFWLRFAANTPKIFAVKSEDIRVGYIRYGLLANEKSRKLKRTQARAHYELIENAERLTSAPALKTSVSRVLILHRFNSWSPLDITIEAFRVICGADNVIASFIKIVMGFGQKLSSEDEDFMACYSQTAYQSQENITQSKTGDNGRDSVRQKHIDSDSKRGIYTSSLCYNLRHMERHGRALDDPWSCRQSAIHQTIFLHDEKTRIIMIQPPESLGQSLSGDTFIDVSHPMNLHLRFLTASLAEWRDYLNYISSQVTELDMRIAICKPYGEFGLDLSCKQRVRSLRRKLFHSESILVNTRSTMVKIRRHEQRLADEYKLLPHAQDSFQHDMDNLSTEVDSHLQMIRKLLNTSFDIKTMYDDIINLSNQDLMHHNAIRLSQIAEMDSRENKMMMSVSNKMCRDSRTMRIATVIAMVYLPANLVLSFFSTSFVWLQEDGQSNGGGDPALRVHHEIWIAVIAISLLAACTVATSWWWDWRERTSDCLNVEDSSATSRPLSSIP